MKFETEYREKTLNNGLISGTPDLITVFDGGRVAWVNDSKFGYKVVERAELNLQLRAYAMLVYDFLDKSPAKVFVSITQPRLSYSEGKTLAVYAPEDIEASREEITFIINRANEKHAKLIAGEAQCRYCLAKLDCPAFNKWIAIPVGTFPDVKKDLSKPAREAYLAQRLSELTDEQLEKTHIACSLAAMLKPLETDEIRKRIAAGGMDNYYLGKPRTERELVDSQRAIALLTLGKVATRDEILAMSKLPLGELEEAYRKKTGCTWKEAKDKINKVLNPVIERKEEKPWVIRK